MNNYGVDYGGLKPGLYLQWGTMVKALDVAHGSDVLNWAKLFGLEKVDDDVLAAREPWTATALSRRAEKMLGVPYAWVTGEDTELDKAPFGMNDRKLFRQIDKALQIKEYGAFLHKVRMSRKGQLSRIIWLDPDTMTPDYDTATHEEGVKRFLRHVNGKREWLQAEDIIWFDREGMGELRPDPAPIEASRLDAEILYNLRRVMDSLYEGNGLPIMLVKVPQGTTDDEVERVRSRFDRLFNRISGTRQVKTIGMRGELEVEALQLTPNDMQMDQTEARHGPAVLGVHHVPESVARSNAANYATAINDRIDLSETMATRLEDIADVFNNDPDMMLSGVRLEVYRDQIPVLSDDTLKQAQAFASYVAGGLPVDLAAAEVGIELPDGLNIVITAEMPEEADEMPMEPDARKTEEVGRLRRFIKNGTHKKGKMFTSDILTLDEIDAEIFANEWRSYP